MQDSKTTERVVRALFIVATASAMAGIIRYTLMYRSQRITNGLGPSEPRPKPSSRSTNLTQTGQP
jgi:hypothetical protein